MDLNVAQQETGQNREATEPLYGSITAPMQHGEKHILYTACKSTDYW